MKKIIIPAFLGLIALYSCNGGGSNTPANLTGKWNATSIESPTEDSMAEVQLNMYMQQIDQIDKVDPEMAKEFKTNNLDSVKSLLKQRVSSQKDQMLEERKKSAEQFKIELLSDGTAIVPGMEEGKQDTAVWYSTTVKDKQILFIDPVIVGKPGSILSFQVVENSGDNMKLAFHQNAEMKAFVSLTKQK